MPGLLILHPADLGGENHGVRVQHIDTLEALLRDRDWNVEATDALNPQLATAALSADLLLVQMPGAAEVEAIVRLRRARGLPTVFEITDNFLAINDWARPGHLLGSPLIRQQILYHASLCDALQIYARGLSQLFAGVNDRVLSFDPYVPIPEQVPPRPAGFVVGWGGTRSHEPDLAAVAPAVVAFCRRHPDASFAYMGALEVFARHFGDLDPAQTTARRFGDHDAYLDFVAGLDVGLAPLRPSPFNAARTDTRFGTYAAFGVAAVLEDGPVYGPHHDRARLFRTPEDLVAILEELHASPAAVAELAARGRAWATAERSAGALADQRDRAYRSLLGEGRRANHGGSADQATPTGDPAALKAATALPAAQALEAAEEILSRHPGYEQAHLLLAGSLERLGRHAEALDHIGRLTPSAVYADLFCEIQARCARRVAPAEVGRHVQGIASPFRRARLRVDGSVLERSRAILEHQPYEHFALASAIKLVEAGDPHAEELDALYERACLVAPDAVPRGRRPPGLTPFLPA